MFKEKHIWGSGKNTQLETKDVNLRPDPDVY